jgi:uncharacterized protein YkwD
MMRKLSRRRVPGNCIGRLGSMLQSIPEDDGVHIFEDDQTDLHREKLDMQRQCHSSSPSTIMRNKYVSSDLENISSSCPIPIHASSPQSILRRINKERHRRGLKLLKESDDLILLAEEHAQNMVNMNKVFHSVRSIDELMTKLQSTLAAENIQRGDSVILMHEETMLDSCISRENILSPHFSEFGCAVLQGADGKIYSCQLFRD